MERPVITDYMNVFQYLQDYYTFRKKRDPKFSYSSWSAELGIKNKSYIRFVALGKRPMSPKFRQNIITKLDLDEYEQRVFTALCLYSQSKSDDERKALGKELIRLIRRSPVQDELAQHHEMLMNPVTIMIRTLLTFKDLEKTVKNLAVVLSAPETLVQESLSILEKLGLAVQNKDHTYTSVQKNLKISDNLQSMGMEDFYRKSFQQAIEAIHRSRDSRKYRSWYVALDKEEFQKLTFESESAVRERVLAADGDSFQNKRLYQFLIAAIPVTDEI